MGAPKTPANTTQATNPWKPAEDTLKNILSQANNLFNATGGINTEFIDKEIADLTPEMQELIRSTVSQEGFKDLAKEIQSGARTGMEGISQANNMLLATAKGQDNISSADINTMAKDLYQSERVQSQVDVMTKNVKEGLASEIQALNQQAIASGGMGSSRAGVAEGVAQGKAAEAIATGSAAIQNEAMNSAVSQALATLQGNQSMRSNAASALGSLGIQSGNLMGNTASITNTGIQNALTGASIQQSYNQSVLDNMWSNAMGSQLAGWDNLYRLLNVGTTVGGLGSSGVYTSPSSSVLGNAAVGAATGAAAQAGANFLSSDKRLKDDIIEVAPVTEGAYDGQPVPIPALYEWKWNDLGMALLDGEYSPEIGAIAQELIELGLGDLVVELDVSDHSFEELAKLGTIYCVNYPALFAYIKLVSIGEDHV